MQPSQFEAALADMLGAISILTSPNRSRADREAACVMLVQACDDAFAALQPAPVPTLRQAA